MILVDSSVLIDYFNGIDNKKVKALDEILGSQVLAIGDFILAEVLQGFRNDRDFIQAQNVLKEFPCLNLCGEEIAVKSAINYRKLRKKGITVRKTIDVIIATFCIENDITLLHNDNDFAAFEHHLGLKSYPVI